MNMNMKITKTVAGKFLACATVAMGLLMSSCSDDPIDNGGNEDGDYVVLEGNLDTRTLTTNEKYLLRGQVFVGDGKTLTIEPGTIIFGEKRSKGTLIVTRGGKINANGTQERPVVFTSNQAPGDRDKGDWGGLVILGKATVNVSEPAAEGISPDVYYGGNEDNDNSGSLTFVRVEFAGIELTPNNETNGITFGGVGRGTKLENIQISYGGDDGLEWFGGTVNGKNLIVFATWDDCFDIDNAFSGSLQYGLAIRYGSHADQSQSNGFEWDTAGQDNNPVKTKTVVSNFTIIGPGIDANSYSGNYFSAVALRRNVAGSIFNSVFIGFPRALQFNHASAYDNYVGTGAKDGLIANNIFHARSTEIELSSAAAADGRSVAATKTYLEANDNTISAGATTETSAAFTALGLNPNIAFGKRLKNQYTRPTLAVTSGTLASGAKFNYQQITDAETRNAVAGGDNFTFDKTVAFRGAFGSTDWTAGWAEFDPINKVY